MNIGFEAKRFFSNYTGLGNYSRFIIDALSQFQPEHQYLLYSPKLADNREVNGIVGRKNVDVISPKGLFALPGFSALWRSWGVTNHESIKSLSIFHGLSQELPAGLPSHIKKVVTVHDLIFLRYPQFYNKIDVSIYTKKVKNACENADCIIAISEQTADDVRNFLKLRDASKIKVVYQGVHPIFREAVNDAQVSDVRKKYNLPERFILSVGTIEERKNLLSVVRAISQIPEKDRIHVVAVGRQTEYFQKVVEEAKRLNVIQWFRFPYPVAFTDLPALYKAAEIFVYPSRFEGFGIPLVEALQSRVPVITSTGSCFKEAAGPGALYADPDDHEQLAKSISSLISDRELRHKLIENGNSYIRKFHPEQIASDLMKVYTDLTSR